MLFGIIGAVLALLAAFFLVEPNSTLTAGSPSPNQTMNHVAAPASDGAPIKRDSPPKQESPGNPVESDDDASTEVLEASTSASGGAPVDDGRITRGILQTDRVPANEPPPRARPTASTAATPLNWCFLSQSGFTWQQGPDISAPQHELVSDRNLVWHGSASAHIGAADRTLPAGVVGIMWQGIVATPFRGKRVELSAFARPRIATAGHFFVRTQGGAPLELALSDQKAPRARGINQYVPRDADWAPYRVVHDVPLDAEVMYYGFALYGGGDVWIDDFRISIVDETAALTSSGSIVGNRNIALDASWILPEPLNLDFEFTSDGPTGGVEALHLSCAPGSPTRRHE